uniref:G_PROTEIN_RECEP_F1_2 domain-containing protein n=1 Tax=Caenorhabditis japonica TaxID=281687 RepID=A0A8R1E9N2_CAEJA
MIGVTVNWTVALLIRKLPSLKNSFGRLTASQSIGDAIHSTLFALYFAPMCFFDVEWMKTYSMVCGHLLLIAYDISTYSHFCISVNRFCSIVAPRGLGSAEIARRLQISSSTVRILRRHFAGGPFILQQDWAPSHGSRSTLAVLEAHFPGFLDKNLWPASSPDLNPMDFSVWGMLEGKIAGKVFATVDDLKAALEVAWASIDDGYLRRTVNSVKKRLRACVKARGSNFEILL